MAGRLARAPRPHKQWVEVGPGKGYSYSNVQSALDAVAAAGDSAEDNPYLITVAPGNYDLGGSPIIHSVSHCHVIGAGPRASRLVKTAVGSDTSLGAYNLGAGASGSPGITRNVTLAGLAIINRMAGGSGTGLPPEPALSIGKTSDTTQAWDDIHVEECHIIGNHDGLQLFNYTTTRGKAFIRSNFIAAVHDAYTLKTVGEIVSSGNQIYVNDAGLPALAGTGFSLDVWKSTGIHFGVGSSPTIPIDPLLDKFLSVGDSIVVRATGQSFGQSGTPNQRYACGVLWYNGSQAVYPSRFNGLSVDVRYNETVASAPQVAGIMLETGTSAASDGLIHFSGGQIHVDQAGASGTAPTQVACVKVGGGPSTTRHLRIVGAILAGRNAQAGGSCLGLQTVHANARIKAAVYSELANDTAGGTLGVITAWAPNGSL